MVVAQIAMTALRALLVLVFAAALVGKLRDPGAEPGAGPVQELGRWVAGLRIVPERMAGPAARAVLAAEGASVLLLLTPWTVLPGLVLAAGLLGVFAAAAWSVRRRGIRATCRCFGRSDAPLGLRHVVRDALLGLAALAGLAGSGLGAPAVPGLALGAGCGFLLALGAVYLDDIAMLFDF